MTHPKLSDNGAAKTIAASQRLRAVVDATMNGIDIPKRRRKPRRPGPRTQAGRAAVALNAVKHGITTGRVPLPGEDVAACEAHRQAISDAYAVVGPIEEALATRIAELLWRLRRVAPYELTLAETSRERVALDFKKEHGWSQVATVEEIEELLEGAQEAAESLAVVDDPQRPLMAAASDAFSDAIADSGATPEVAEHEPDTGGWTTGTMSSAVRALADHRGLSADDLMSELIAFLEGSILRHRQRLEFILDEQDRMRRDRTLPPQQELINLSKYELGLNRMLFQAMHELEALQSRRSGTPIPLARVQISAGG